MSHYWNDPSSPTFEHPPLVRPASPPGSPWEYARLGDVLRPGGSAPACIQRLDANTLVDSESVVEVFDYILPDTTELAADTIVEIQRHFAFGKWCLHDWTAARD